LKASLEVIKKQHEDENVQSSETLPENCSQSELISFAKVLLEIDATESLEPS
jgi:hypothetical protein